MEVCSWQSERLNCISFICTIFGWSEQNTYWYQIVRIWSVVSPQFRHGDNKQWGVLTADAD